MNQSHLFKAYRYAALLFTLLVSACGGGGGNSSQTETLLEFELADVGPTPNARQQPIYQFARLAFSEPLDSDVSENDFGFFDITTLDESEETVTAIPFRLEKSANTSVVFLHPEEELPKNATLLVGAMEGLKAASGEELSETIGFKFYTIRDDDEPVLTEATPAQGDNQLSVHPNFTLTYNEDLYGTESDFLTTFALRERDHVFSGWSTARNIETRVVVEGNMATITPTHALNYNNDYHLTIGRLRFSDQYGNTAFQHYEYLNYKTKPYPDSTQLPYTMDYHVFDASSNAIIGFNKQQAEFIKISFTDSVSVATFALPETPSSFCLHRNSQRIYTTFKDSDVIRGYDTDTMLESTHISWTPRESTEQNIGKDIGFGEFDLYCGNDSLYVSSYRNTDRPWSISRISLKAPHTQVFMQDTKDIGDIVQVESGDLYVTERADNGIGKIQRVRHMHDQGDHFDTLAEWRITDNIVRGYTYPAKFEANFDSRHLIISDMIYALDNMPGRLKLFEFSETVLAVDSVKGRIYTSNGVYNFDEYEPTHSTIIPGADIAAFDNQGNLILIDNDTNQLFFIDERGLSTSEFP